MREIRHDLPRNFYAELPKLADGRCGVSARLRHRPRAGGAHGRRVDLDTLVDFPTAYQRVAPLSIGEIWAVPIMLRIALVEELSRLADGRIGARSRLRAVGAAGRTGNRVRLAVDESAPRGGSERRLSAAFVVELLQWLRDQPPSAAPAWHALQRALEAPGRLARRTAADRAPAGSDRSARHRQRDRQHAAAVVGRLAARSSIASAWSSRSCAAIPRAPTRRWTFRRATATATRSRSCRQAIAPVRDRRGATGRSRWRAGGSSERSRTTTGATTSATFWSRGAGSRSSASCAIRRPSARAVRAVRLHAIRRWAISVSIAVTIGAQASPACWRMRSRQGASTGRWCWLPGAVVLIPVSELAISLLNAHPHLRSPRPLPSSTMRGGIPADARTMVVVPGDHRFGGAASCPPATTWKCGSWPIAMRICISRC